MCELPYSAKEAWSEAAQDVVKNTFYGSVHEVVLLNLVFHEPPNINQGQHTFQKRKTYMEGSQA